MARNEVQEGTWTCPHCDHDVGTDETACQACGQLREPGRCDRHADRTANGRCVICGTTVCEECDSGNAAAYRCPAHADVSIIAGWAQIYSTSDDIEAQLIAGNLRAEGLTAQVLSQKDHSLTVDFGDLSPVRVLVPATAYEEGRRVLAEHMDETGEVSFACPSCGEPFDPPQTTCESCGETLPG